MNIVRSNQGRNGRLRTARNPFGPYRDLSEFFDNFFPELNREEKTSFVPAVNIGEDSENYFLEVSAPGYKKEDLNIAVEDNMLTISAERKEEAEDNSRQFSRREFNYSSFRRSFTLPDTVNHDGISCSYENGVLRVNLPKREEARSRPPRKIEIK